MGSLNYTSTLLTLPGEPTRLRVILGTGLKTPTGIITEGAHDFSSARYTYEPETDGDETVTGTSALDDFRGTPSTVKLLEASHTAGSCPIRNSSPIFGPSSPRKPSCRIERS